MKVVKVPKNLTTTSLCNKQLKIMGVGRIFSQGEGIVDFSREKQVILPEIRGRN